MTRAHYLELILYKTYADLRVESERTFIGVLWWIIDPIVTMLIFYVVFGVVLERGSPDYVPFLFTGLVPWRWFTSSLPHAGNSLLQGRGLMQQVYLPKVVLPTVTILTDTVKFAFVFVVLLIFLLVYGCPLGLSCLALPLVVLVQMLLVAAASYIVAALVPFFRDLTFVVDYTLRLLFFVSGIFWSIDAVENEQYQHYLRLNPIASLLDAYRGILLEGEWPSASPLLWIGLVSLGGIYCGVRFMARNDWNYPKVV